MSPGVHGYNFGGVEPRRVGWNIERRLRVGVVRSMVGIELTHGDGERAIDRVASAVRTNRISNADRVGMTARNNGTTLRRILRRPVERQRLDSDLSRVSGQDDSRRVVTCGGAGRSRLRRRCCTIGRELFRSQLRCIHRAWSVGLRKTTQGMSRWSKRLRRRRRSEREVGGLRWREAVGPQRSEASGTLSTSKGRRRGKCRCVLQGIDLSQQQCGQTRDENRTGQSLRFTVSGTMLKLPSDDRVIFSIRTLASRCEFFTLSSVSSSRIRERIWSVDVVIVLT